MTQIRLDVERLAEQIDDALAHMDAGDEVLLARGGKVVARLEPKTEPGGEHGLAAYLRARAKHGFLDEESIRLIEEAHEVSNRPARELSWE